MGAMTYRAAAAASLVLALAPALVAVQRTWRRKALDGSLRGGSAAVLHERIRTLEAQVGRLEEHRRTLEAERDEFLATLSHELRSPLNAMLGWVELLRLHIHDPALQAHALTVIERNARAEARIVDELLQAARLMMHRMPLVREPVALPQVVSVAVDGLRRAADAKEITLEVTTPDGLEIVGDRMQLEHAVTHLLDNAIKFTAHGGRIAVRLDRDDLDAVLTVADTGIGIARDMLPVVFEPFRQLERGLTRRYGGLGLGLTIARHVADLHGGTLTAASGGPGAGSTFTLRLPMRAGP